jgi:hypothetical protein
MGRSDLPVEIGDCSVDRLEMLYKNLQGRLGG